MGIEAALAFPLVVTTEESKPATYLTALRLLIACKVVEVLDALLSAGIAGPLSARLDVHPPTGRVGFSAHLAY